MARALHVALSLLGVCTLTVALTAQTRYIYDELGRLVGVIDSSGDAAVYHYDAVGNLLSITRSTPTQVTIIEFTPDSGPIGQTVTIYGTGFGATTGQNTVTFNGTSASITSASTTQLVVSVPSGATTGIVAVTSPLGSDTSDSAFAVTTSNAPTITSFAPTSAVAGTSVTITGTNYDAVAPANNQSRFNSSFTAATAATSTTVTAPVPASTGSGRLTIRTIAGTAVSADDFIIPPPPYVVSDVASATRLSFASATTVTVATANKIALRLVDGTVGQRVSLLGTNGVTGQVLGCDVLVSILNPFASALAPAGCMEGSGFLDVKTLTTAGTYTILVDPASTATGSVTLTLYEVPADFSATITPGGSSVTATMPTPGQNGALTFTGTPGQRISVLGTNGLSGQIGLSCDVLVSVVKPDGGTLATPSCMESSGFIDVQTLPVAGTYRLVVNPVGHAVGNLTLTLYDVPADYSGTISAGGSAVTASMPTPGQNGALTFSGTSGQRISVAGTNGLSGFIGFSCDVHARILKPDTSVLVGNTCMEGSGFIDVTTLPSTGTYTIVVDPVSQAFGNVTLTLHDVPADHSGTITAGGSAVTVSMPTAGQNGALTFSGTSGQRISLAGSNAIVGIIAFACDVNVRILKPDTSVLAANTCMEGSGFIDTTTLPTTGTYTIVVDPVSYAVGNVTLTLYDVPANYSGTITPGGSAVTASMPTPGQNGAITFSGTSGQRVLLAGTNGLTGFLLSCDVHARILKPDTSVLAANACMEGSGVIETVTLPTTGTYTIVVDPVSYSSGSVTLTLHDVPADTTGTVTIGGSAVAVTLGAPGQTGRLTFSGTASQQVTVRLTSNTYGSLTVQLLKADGSVLTSAGSTSSNFNLATHTLPTTGTYTIVVNPAGTNTGTVNVAVTNP